MRRTKKDAEITKLKIFRCALNLFIEKGYGNTTLSDITHEAGVTKGALYWHFKDKNSLLEEIIDHYDKKAVKSLPDILSLKISPLMKIKFLVYDNIPYKMTKKQIKNFFRLKVEMSKSYVEKKNQPYAMNFIKIIKELLELGKKTGEIKKDVHEDITALTISLILTGTYVKYDISEKLFYGIDDIPDIMDNYLGHISTNKGAANTSGHRKLFEKLLPKHQEF